jgi:fructose-1,6-bisphosphatase/inositol monophosphatase family enzyme
MLENPQEIVHRLLAFQRKVRDAIVSSRQTSGLHEVERESTADTIYRIDAEIDPILDAFCEDWSRTTPLILIAEGFEQQVFPHGTREADAKIRLIVDPIDGTRGIMYDKRSAWSLAGVAPNKGSETRLRDIEVAAMTELPTSKMGSSDVLWAIKGQGFHARRDDLRNGTSHDLTHRPSQADNIDHGFASVSSFFPGTKVLAAELMEHLARHLVGDADTSRAMVFDDQYISTGGQFYELIAGHDRFIADLRPVLYHINRQPEGLCCHPYDCSTLLIVDEAGAIVTDERGDALDGPLDTTTGLSWIAYANHEVRRRIEPLVRQFLADRRFS